MDTTKRQVSSATTKERPLAQDILYAVGYWLAAFRSRFGPRGLVILATAVIGGGLALNWGWVVALGIAPIVLMALPCAAMCAIGMCKGGKGKQSCSSGGSEEEERKSGSPRSRSPDGQ